MKYNLRNNALLLMSVVVYVAAVVLTAISFDLQFYQPVKSELVQMKYVLSQDINLPVVKDNQCIGVITQYLQTTQPDLKSALEKVILDKFIKAVESDFPILSCEVVQNDKTVISRKRTDNRVFNNFKNSLILRDFRQPLRKSFQTPAGKEVGFIIVECASPEGFEPLETLTREYRYYLFSILIGITLCYFLLLRFLILPVKKITEAIQESSSQTVCFIHHPHTRIERLYNRMARDAQLTALSSGLYTPGSLRLRQTLGELVDFLVPRIVEWFGFTAVWLADLEWEGREKLGLVRQMPAAKNSGGPSLEPLKPLFDAALARNLHTSLQSNTSRLFHCVAPGERKGHLFVGAIPGGDSEKQIRALVLWLDKPLDRDQLSWYETTADHLYRQIIGLVEKQMVQSRELFREKSEANISLSRNLGHDLTNIIATNKLELMTVGQLLRSRPNDWLASKENAEILTDSLKRILDNTRGLQEIVNLYRAYEYLRNPRYEETDLNKLIGEILDIFKLCMSAPAQISCNLASNLTAVYAEPRLLKLAIFNLLTNAQDAIRRLPGDSQSSARISVQTLFDRAKKKVFVRLSDSGPGIRRADGTLASEEEIENIFELGYTTKPGGQGEGLGLNWVRTILRDFHKGELAARNLPRGGALFEFSLDPAKKR